MPHATEKLTSRKSLNNSQEPEDGELPDEESPLKSSQSKNDSRNPRKRRRRSPSPLFYFDDKPVRSEEQESSSSRSESHHVKKLTPNAPKTQELVESATSLENDSALLLPDHVTVNGETNGVPVIEEASTLIGAEEDEFIFYADMDDSRNVCMTNLAIMMNFNDTSRLDSDIMMNPETIIVDARITSALTAAQQETTKL